MKVGVRVVVEVGVGVEVEVEVEVGVLGVDSDGPNRPKVGFGNGKRNGRFGGSGRRSNTNVGVKTFAHLDSIRGTPTATQWCWRCCDNESYRSLTRRSDRDRRMLRGKSFRRKGGRRR